MPYTKTSKFLEFTQVVTVFFGAIYSFLLNAFWIPAWNNTLDRSINGLGLLFISPLALMFTGLSLLSFLFMILFTVLADRQYKMSGTPNTATSTEQASWGRTSMRPWKSTFLVFLGCCLIFGIVTLLWPK